MRLIVLGAAQFEWYWAAAIQIVFRYHTTDVSEEMIAARPYGVSADGRHLTWPGSFDVITANLNDWSSDDGGHTYRVRAELGQGTPPRALLLDEVGGQGPVILSYMSGPAGDHAVVAAAVSLIAAPDGPARRVAMPVR